MDIEMGKKSTTDTTRRDKNPEQHVLTIDNLSPQIWCREPKMKIDQQRTMRPFKLDRPDGMTNLPTEAWSAFRNELLTTWKLLRNQALTIYAFVFAAIFVVLVISLLTTRYLLIVVAVAAVASATYGIRHQSIRGDRMRRVASQHREVFQRAGYKMEVHNGCRTVLKITIRW